MNLSKTNLNFEEGLLSKRDGSGNTISTFKIEDIQEVRMKTKYEFIGPMFVILPSLALAYVCKLHVANELWSWVGTIAFGTLVLLGIVITKAHYIEVTTDKGKVEYPVADQIEDANGFIVALQHEVAPRH